MDYALTPVATEADWQALHALRRATLFAPGRHPGIVYDDNHPDDHAPDHVPYLLLRDGAPIGMVRLDFRGDTAVVRLVAIAPELQRQGHGTVLDRLVCETARARGVHTLVVNSAPTQSASTKSAAGTGTSGTPLNWPASLPTACRCARPCEPPSSRASGGLRTPLEFHQVRDGSTMCRCCDAISPSSSSRRSRSSTLLWPGVRSVSGSTMRA
jgi:GNAT superfamily N-acetyltransferase